MLQNDKDIHGRQMMSPVDFCDPQFPSSTARIWRFCFWAKYQDSHAEDVFHLTWHNFFYVPQEINCW